MCEEEKNFVMSLGSYLDFPIVCLLLMWINNSRKRINVLWISGQIGIKFIQFHPTKIILTRIYRIYTKIKILCKENTTVICTMNASYNVGTATLMWDLREIEQKKLQQKNSACGLHGVDI